MHLFVQEVMEEKILISFFPKENQALHANSLIYLVNLRDLNSFIGEIEANKFYALKNLVRHCFDNIRVFCEHYCMLSSEANKFTKIQSICEG